MSELQGGHSFIHRPERTVALLVRVDTHLLRGRVALIKGAALALLDAVQDLLRGAAAVAAAKAAQAHMGQRSTTRSGSVGLVAVSW